MSSNQSGEGEIRKATIEADLVDCMVALPGQLFYSTQIPVCLWFLTRSKTKAPFRKRQGETLFIDARKMGTLINRVQRELNDADISTIANTYHAWRGDTIGDTIEEALLKEAIQEGTEKGSKTDQTKKLRKYIAETSGNRRQQKYADVPGFCKSATLEEIRHHDHILTPGRYVGAAEVEDDGELFDDKMKRLTAELRDQTKEAARLDKLIWANLEDLGYGGERCAVGAENDWRNCRRSIDNQQSVRYCGVSIPLGPLPQGTHTSRGLAFNAPQFRIGCN